MDSGLKQPYTDEVLVQLAQSGIRKLLVLCPAFVADCLETLEEIGITAREQNKVPVKLVRITLSHSSVFISATEEAGNIAALLTKISMVPNSLNMR